MSRRCRGSWRRKRLPQPGAPPPHRSAQQLLPRRHQPCYPLISLKGSGRFHMAAVTDLRDSRVASAINALERRAERQDSELTLFNTYVDGGVLTELSDKESQIIHGRRGVGKTHLLHFH